MAVYIPIVSEFNSKGIDRAVKEFQSLGTVGAKANFALKKAALPAAAAVGALAVALGDATKAAIEDDAAQQELARQLTATTGANSKQIASVEGWISAQGKLLGITDDDLRPALAGLVRATGSVSEAQKLATAAMDLAAQKGVPLASVTKTLERAYGGNLKALAKLAPEYRQMIEDGASFEDVMYAIGTATGGAASTAANTAQGQFKRLSISLQETKESIGAALMPAIQAVLPVLSSLANFAAENSTAFLAVAGVIGTLAGIILAYNAYLKLQAAYTIAATVATAAFNLVMSLNPISLVVIAIVALIAGLVLAYKKFEGFRNIVDSVFSVVQTVVSVSIGVIKGYFETLYGFYKGIFNGIASLWNNTIGKLSFKVPSWVPGLGGKGFDVPNIPMLADGGIVTSATLAMIGEKGPEAVIPLDRMGQMGGGNNVTIHVNGGDPNAVVQALRTYMRQNGSVPIKISNAY
jgi:hypothetical protein